MRGGGRKARRWERSLSRGEKWGDVGEKGLKDPGMEGGKGGEGRRGEQRAARRDNQREGGTGKPRYRMLQPGKEREGKLLACPGSSRSRACSREPKRSPDAPQPRSSSGAPPGPRSPLKAEAAHPPSPRLPLPSPPSHWPQWQTPARRRVSLARALARFLFPLLVPFSFSDVLWEVGRGEPEPGFCGRSNCPARQHRRGI